MRTPPLLAALAIATLLTSLAPLSPASDALLDAKRDAAAKLLKDGKTADAQKLYEEVIAADDTTWSDHYALAKIYDKAGETPKAVEAYRQTTKLLKNKARASAERSALADAEKRLKVLDELSARLEELLERFEAELKPLAKEADRSVNADVSARVEAVREALAIASTKARKVQLAVAANEDWVDTGVDLSAGWTITIQATGVWNTLSGNPNFSSDANGRASAGQVGGLPVGMLLAKIGQDGTPVSVGARRTVTAGSDGRLFLACNDEGRRDNVGELTAIIIKR